jgi:hypothetical protein
MVGGHQTCSTLRLLLPSSVHQPPRFELKDGQRALPDQLDVESQPFVSIGEGCGKPEDQALGHPDRHTRVGLDLDGDLVDRPNLGQHDSELADLRVAP